MHAASTPLRILLVDDEQPARARLRRLLEPLMETGRVAILGEAADGVEALEILRTSEIDLVFLDVQMPELGGFDVLERIDPEDRPAFVLTTAYDQYAIRAFEENAVDYLLKPVSRERLEEAVLRAERARPPAVRNAADARVERLLDWLETNRPATSSTEGGRAAQHLRQISIPYRDRILVVPVGRIISAEIAESITRLYVLDDEASTTRSRIRQHVVNYTLDQLEANLDPAEFMRVHRSAIVQLSHIQEMIPWFSGRYKLVLTGGHEVIASRERSKQIKDLLML